MITCNTASFIHLKKSTYYKVLEPGENSQTSLDDNNNDILTLITYMNIWRAQKRLLLPDPKNVTKEQMRAYELWKSRFAGNTMDYFASMEKEILEHYKPLIELVER